MAQDKSNPPDQWFSTSLVKLNDETYYLPPPKGEGPDQIIVWHWCVALGRWEGAYCANHKILQQKPLTLDPSLACAYNNAPGPAGVNCPWHGWIRDGEWVPAA